VELVHEVDDRLLVDAHGRLCHRLEVCHELAPGAAADVQDRPKALAAHEPGRLQVGMSLQVPAVLDSGRREVVARLRLERDVRRAVLVAFLD
jgi:hypothetical protein